MTYKEFTIQYALGTLVKYIAYTLSTKYNHLYILARDYTEMLERIRRKNRLCYVVFEVEKSIRCKRS